MADDLAAFVTARLDEDEEIAKAVRPKDWDDIGWAGVGATATAHAAQHDPARVLREVAAKRAIMAVHAQLNDSIWCQTCDPGADPFGDSDAWYPCRTVRALATAWSDHPDYKAKGPGGVPTSDR